MSKQYRLYGLVVESEVPILEVPPLERPAQPDVQIVYGRLSGDMKDHPNYAPVYAEAPEIAWYCNVDGQHHFFGTQLGAFEITGGNRIVVEALKDPEDALLRNYMVGTAFGSILCQRGYIPFHSGSLKIADKTLLVVGHSGAGKSTLTSALVARGYPFLSDDVTPVSVPETGPCVAHSAYPQRKLSARLCSELGYDTTKLRRVVKGNLESKFAITDDSEWYDGTLPLGWFVEVTLAPEDAPLTLTEITGSEKLGLLIKNLYRRSVFMTLGISPPTMKQLLTIAAQIPMFRVARPQCAPSRAAVDAVTDIVLEALGKTDETQGIV